MAPLYQSELLVKYEPVRKLWSSQRDLYVVRPILTNFYMVNIVLGMLPQSYGTASQIILNIQVQVQ